MFRNNEQGKQKNKANEVRNPDDNESRYKIGDKQKQQSQISWCEQQDIARFFIRHLRILSSH